MNDHSPITSVTFSETARKFYFELRPSACDNLLLSCHSIKGITLWHSNKNELEAFRQQLIRLNNNAGAGYSEGKKAMQRKIFATLFLAVFVCLFVYTSDIFSNGIFYRWLLNFMAILMLFALYKIAVKYLFETSSHGDTARLQRDLDLMIIHNRIREEFSG